MWNPENVERALFAWNKWLESIVDVWASFADESMTAMTLPEIRAVTTGALSSMNLTDNLWLRIYWICCVVSDYRVNVHTTFGNILVPHWLPRLFRQDPSYKSGIYELRRNKRAYPPFILNEKDIDFLVRQTFGFKPTDRSRFYPGQNTMEIFLASDHELYGVLSGFKGRPKASGTAGRHGRHSDRLAVKCAALKDRNGMTYLEIAEKMKLPVTQPYFTKQSDLARHLVSRGRKLLDLISGHDRLIEP